MGKPTVDAINTTKTIICPNCDGEGRTDRGVRQGTITGGDVCTECNGSGKLVAKVVKQGGN